MGFEIISSLNLPGVVELPGFKADDVWASILIKGFESKS